ncbi:MAG: 30S ribosome-binding factor RbfA [Holophagaceae bacterium]|nr:30S ribosome-binding factor RbfA [Holophagaceae bacterium]
MNRPERLEDQIQFLLSTIVLRELRDPELGFVTITAVRLTPDRSQARVYFTALPTEGGSDEAQTALSRKALGRAAGFLRTHLAKVLDMKRVPELKFFPDASLAEGNRMESLLAELEKERAARPVEPEAPETPEA